MHGWLLLAFSYQKIWVGFLRCATLTLFLGNDNNSWLHDQVIPYRTTCADSPSALFENSVRSGCQTVGLLLPFSRSYGMGGSLPPPGFRRERETSNIVLLPVYIKDSVNTFTSAISAASIARCNELSSPWRRAQPCYWPISPMHFYLIRFNSLSKTRLSHGLFVALETNKYMPHSRSILGIL